MLVEWTILLSYFMLGTPVVTFARPTSFVLRLPAVADGHHCTKRADSVPTAPSLLPPQEALILCLTNTMPASNAVWLVSGPLSPSADASEMLSDLEARLDPSVQPDYSSLSTGDRASTSRAIARKVTGRTLACVGRVEWGDFKVRDSCSCVGEERTQTPPQWFRTDRRRGHTLPIAVIRDWYPMILICLVLPSNPAP